MAKNARMTKIHYGTPEVPLWWMVKTTDAKHNVTINGTLMDALTGAPGQTIGCHLSNCVVRNQDVFPHPVYWAAFNKRTAQVIDKITNGSPSHAVRYQHTYGDLVDLNDTDRTRRTIQENPELVERKFTLLVPHKSKTKGGSRKHGHDTGQHSPRVPRGALARAIKAGLVSATLPRSMGRGKRKKSTIILGDQSER